MLQLHFPEFARLFDQRHQETDLVTEFLDYVEVRERRLRLFDRSLERAGGPQPCAREGP
ncbi:MAG: hypothetical protein ACRDTT_11155 [Pseudonocardiaceae bacterium]